MLSKRDQILAALSAFIRQRPGLEYGNYGNPTSYRAEVRSITRDRHDALELLKEVSWRSGIGEAELRTACQNAFSGRLTLVEKGDSVGFDYCTGQYFPTEYRKAACAVLVSALWTYWRENAFQQYKAYPAGDTIRRYARKELSRRVASRWFN